MRRWNLKKNLRLKSKRENRRRNSKFKSQYYLFSPEIVPCFLSVQRKEKNLNFHKSVNNSKSKQNLNKNLTQLNLESKLTLKCKKKILPPKRLKSQSLMANLKKNQEKRQKKSLLLLSQHLRIKPRSKRENRRKQNCLQKWTSKSKQELNMKRWSKLSTSLHKFFKTLKRLHQETT